MSVKIISATMTVEEGNKTEILPVSEEHYKKDLPKINKIHEKMMKEDPTWPFFGGMVHLGNRTYQVSP